MTAAHDTAVTVDLTATQYVILSEYVHHKQPEMQIMIEANASVTGQGSCAKQATCCATA